MLNALILVNIPAYQNADSEKSITFVPEIVPINLNYYLHDT